MSKYEYEFVADNFNCPSEVQKDYDLFYRCKNCGGIIPSLPKDSIGCECSNVFIDIDYHRLDVEDFSLFEVLRRKKVKS